MLSQDSENGSGPHTKQASWHSAAEASHPLEAIRGTVPQVPSESLIRSAPNIPRGRKPADSRSNFGVPGLRDIVQSSVGDQRQPVGRLELVVGVSLVVVAQAVQLAVMWIWLSEIHETLKSIQQDLAAIREDINAIQEDLAVIKEDLAAIREDFAGIRRSTARLKTGTAGGKRLLQPGPVPAVPTAIRAQDALLRPVRPAALTLSTFQSGRQRTPLSVADTHKRTADSHSHVPRRGHPGFRNCTSTPLDA